MPIFDFDRTIDNSVLNASLLLPEGVYTLVVVEAKVKKSKAGSQGIGIKWQVHGGEHSDKTFYEDFWLKCNSTVAENIAKSNLKTICECADVAWETFDDEHSLEGAIVEAVVSVKKGTGNYPDGNRCKKLRDPRQAVAEVSPAATPEQEATTLTAPATWG
jgi:hypothetical protein